MRILHIDKFFPPNGGVGSYIRALGQLQRRAGHEVLGFGCVGETGPAQMPRFFDFASARNPGALARMVHNSQAAAALDKWLKGRPIDVAHLHNTYHHLSPSILGVLVRRRIAMVMTVHDYRLACPTKFFLRPDGVCMRCLPNRFYHAASPNCAGLGGAALAAESLVQRFCRRYFRPVSFFICPTRFMRDVLVRTGLPRSKAVVAPNPVEPLELPRGVVQAGRELLFVGRLMPEKAPGLMLDLAAELPDARITIVGDGPLLGALREEVRRRAMANVELVGAVEHARLGEHYARATAVVLTSAWMENSPQAMLEAMAAGRCVIVPDHPPLREWVQDGLTGRTFAAGDGGRPAGGQGVRSLADAARAVLDDRAGREQMAARGRQLVLGRHDGQAIARRLDGLYEEAIRRCALQ